MLIVFDMDGTLVESSELHAITFAQVFRENGFPEGIEQVRNMKGHSELFIIREITGVGPDRAKEILDTKVKLFLKGLAKIKELPGATQLLTELKNQDHKIALATSSTRREANAILKQFGWYDMFDAIFTMDDVIEQKPKPEMLHKIANQLGKISWMIGDSPRDREMAEAAGVPVLILKSELNQLLDFLDRI
ncbi:MAG: HAD family hydrolase [Candidatus Altiarchaeota archaeon]|nr:HAD family hydrolase [Candidatus Altiarchaeota archaeon]